MRRRPRLCFLSRCRTDRSVARSIDVARSARFNESYPRPRWWRSDSTRSAVSKATTGDDDGSTADEDAFEGGSTARGLVVLNEKWEYELRFWKRGGGTSEGVFDGS